MNDLPSLAKLLVRVERETTRSVLQAQMSIATSLHLLARVADATTPLIGAMPRRAAPNGGKERGAAFR
jgi:hypothetical protein